MGLPFENDERVVAYLKGGANLSEIARLLNVTRERIRQIARRNGIVITTNRMRNIDILSIVRQIRENPDITSLNKVSKIATHNNNNNIMIALAALDMLESINRLFRLRKYRQKKIKIETTKQLLIEKYFKIEEELGREPNSGDLTVLGMQMGYYKYWGSFDNFRIVIGRSTYRKRRNKK